jgi:hypothetical protein
MQQIPAVLSQLGDHKLDVQFIAEFLVSETQNVMLSPELLILQGISHCNHFNDPLLKCECNINFTLVLGVTAVMSAKFYLAAGIHHFYFGSNPNMSHQFLERALKLARSCGHTDTQSVH